MVAAEMTKEELADALERTDLGPDAVELLISQHRDIEEQIFYPTVATEVPDVEDGVQEDLEEHRRATCWRVSRQRCSTAW